MIRYIALTAITMVISFHATGAADDTPPAEEAATTPAPVSLSAKTIQADSNDVRTIEIELAIGESFEIYSQHEHEFTLPLKAELLDENLRPFKSKIQYPKPKKIPFDKALGGDYFVYSGKPSL